MIKSSKRTTVLAAMFSSQLLRKLKHSSERFSLSLVLLMVIDWLVHIRLFWEEG